MSKPIFSITPFTLLDYPAHTACIIWFAGCNMRCLYCYNPTIVCGKGKLTISEAVEFLQSRRHLLQAVVFSGGECTLHPSIIRLAKEAKQMGYLIKIDTNGTRPDRIRRLLQDNLVDYIALDFKATQQQHRHITQSETWDSFINSFTLIQEAPIPFEVRTTWHSELLSTDDLQEMVSFLDQRNYKGNYFIQRYVNGVPTVGNLPYSHQYLDTENLSCNEVQVILR